MDQKPISGHAFDLTTSGTQYALAWTISGGLALSGGFFSQALATEGVLTQQWTPSTGTTRSAKVTWNGSNFGFVALNDNTGATQPVFVSASPAGATVVNLTALGTPANVPSVDLASSSNGWVLAYVDAAKDVYAAPLSASGAVSGTPLRLSASAHDSAVVRITKRSPEKFLVAWAADVAWSDGRVHLYQLDVRARLVSFTGPSTVASASEVLDPSRAPGAVQWLSAAKSQDVYLLTWQQASDAATKIQAALATSAGEVLTPSGLSLFQGSELTQYTAASAATPSGFLMVSVAADGVHTTPFSQRISLSGEVSAPVALTTTPGFNDEFIRLATDGNTFVAAWRNWYLPGQYIDVVHLDEDGVPYAAAQRISLPGTPGELSIAMQGDRAVLAYLLGEGTQFWNAAPYHLRYRVLPFSGGGFSIGSEQVLTTGTPFAQPWPKKVQVAGTPSGGFTFAWAGWQAPYATIEGATMDVQGQITQFATPLAVYPSEPLGPFLGSAFDQELVVWGFSYQSALGYPYPASGRFVVAGAPAPASLLNVTLRNNAVALAPGRRAGEFLLAYADTPGSKISTRFIARDDIPFDPDDHDHDGFVAGPSDCDDSNPNVWVSCATCTDADTDTSWVGCDAYLTVAGLDCDDASAARRPGATELCDGIDNDCDGLVDEDFNLVGSTCFSDVDGDGFRPADGDCDDNNTNVWFSCATCGDQDGDGLWSGCDRYWNVYGPDCDAGSPTSMDCLQTDRDGDGKSASQGDCNDASAAMGADAAELCSTLYDDDCDGLINAEDDDVLASDGFAYNVDNDGDDYGGSQTQASCAPVAPPGLATTGGDCNDGDASVYPGASDPCGGVDSNCEPDVDVDGDNHYASGCAAPDDCDDKDASAWDVCVAAARLTTYQYDALGRMVSQQTTSGAEVIGTTYHYGNFTGSPAVPGAYCVSAGQAFNPDVTLSAGRLTWVEHGAGITYYGYDGSGEIAAVFLQRDRAVFDVCALEVVRYSHDGLGRITSVTYPSGRQARYTYGDASLRPLSITLFDASGTSMGAVMQDAVYDVDQALVDYVAGAVRFLGSVDKGGAMTRRRYAAGSTALFDWTPDVDGDGVGALERDGSGNYLQLADLASATSFAFGYDGQERLTSVTSSLAASAMNCVYTYDAAGNRTAYTCADDAATYRHIAGSNRLRDTTYTDVDGDCAAAVPATVNGATNRLGEVTRYAKNGCPSDVLTIQYDATGSVVGFDGNPLTRITYDERHLARTMGGSRKLAYDLPGRLLADADADLVTEYVWNGADLVAIISSAPPAPATVHVVGTDHLGSPWRAWTGASATASWSVAYAPFGATTPEDGATSYGATPAITLRRPGQIADSSSDLYQNTYRHLHPASGGYVQADPLIQVSAAWSQGAYAYAGSNPIGQVDPLGLSYLNPYCADILEKIGNLQKNIDRREEQLESNPQNLPYRCDGDQDNPSLSKWGHEALIDFDKANLAYQKALFSAFCGGPPGGMPPVGDGPLGTQNAFDPPYWLAALLGGLAGSLPEFAIP